MSGPIRAAGYIRVSKDKSQGGKKGEIISPAAQEEAIRKLCAENVWESVIWESDIDYSGFKMAYTKRPGLMKLLEAAKNHEFSILCVYRMDRSARRAMEQLDLIGLFGQHGVEVYSATEKFDPKTAAGRFQRNIMAPISEYYSEILSQNIKDARLTMVHNHRVPGGLAPFGLMWREKKLVPDPVTSPMVRRMYEAALNAGTGGAVRSAWEYLESQGVRAPLSGRNWHQDSIRYILRNPIYTGNQRYGDSSWPVDVGALVPEDLWQGVQAVVAKGTARKPRRKYLLAGFIWCGYGGHKYEGWAPSVRYLYEHYESHYRVERYMCRIAHRYLQNGSKCDHPMLAVKGLEAEFVSRLIGWLREREFKDRQTESPAAQEVNETRERLEGLRGKLAQVSAMIDALFDEYQRYKTITRDQFAERKGGLSLAIHPHLYPVE